MDRQAVITVDKTPIACAGESEISGHPRIYLTADKSGEATCPYCGRRFRLGAGAKAPAH